MSIKVASAALTKQKKTHTIIYSKTHTTTQHHITHRTTERRTTNMPAPSQDVRRRRANYRRAKKLTALVNGNGSLRIACRGLDSKSQQMLSDRLHFISTLGKSHASTVFKGLNHHEKKRKKQRNDNQQVPEVQEDYGVAEYQGFDLEAAGIAPHVRGSVGRSRYGKGGRKGGNRIDDLMRIAVLTQAGHESIPGQTGHLYRPPKKVIQFRRAQHVDPFDLLQSDTAVLSTPTLNADKKQRPCTAPGVAMHALPRRARSRQRPVTGPAAVIMMAKRDSNVVEESSLLLSNNWDGLFASRPGTPHTIEAPSVSSSRVSTANNHLRPGGRARSSTPGSRSRCRRSTTPTTMPTMPTTPITTPTTTATSPPLPPPPPAPRTCKHVHGHTSKSRPGTAEHIERSRARKDKRRLRPSTVGNECNSSARRHASLGSSVSSSARPSTSIKKLKYWNHQHSVRARIDAENDYTAILGRLAELRHSCDLVAPSSWI